MRVAALAAKPISETVHMHGIFVVLCIVITSQSNTTLLPLSPNRTSTECTFVYHSFTNRRK